VMTGAGNGTFGSSTTYSVSSTVISLAAADVTGDGLVDLIAGGTGVSLMPGTASGGFGTTQSYSSAGLVLSLGDIDGDGDVDLIVYTELTAVMHNRRVD